MSLNFNRRGELQENTVITAEGNLIFVEEQKYSPSQMEDIRMAEKVLNEIEDCFGTLNTFELMDEGIPKRDLLDYLSARYVLHALGWTKEEDL